MKNVIIIPSKPDGLEFFLKKKYWENIRLNKNMLSSLKYIALYQSAPISSITHYGKITNIESYTLETFRDKNRYRIHFELINTPLNIIFNSSDKRRHNVIQSLRYTTLDLLLNSKSLEELFL